MIDVKVLRAMHKAGASIEAIFAAIEADQAKDTERLNRQRELTTERVRRHRQRRQADCNALQAECNALQAKNTKEINGHAAPVTRYIQESLILSSSSESQRIKKDSREDVTRYFEKFWPPYPKKVGKKAAEKEWAKALKGGAKPEEIIAGLQKTKFPSDPQYIVHPARWLREGRWLDEGAPRNPHREFMKEYGI